MQRILNPFYERVGQYGPNLAGALLALVIGVILAYVIAAVARRIFASTQLDERVARIVQGETQAATFDSAKWLSRVVFWLVIGLAILAFFSALGFTPVTVPIQNALGIALGFLPNLFAAVALILLAWLVASFLRVAVRRALDALHVDARLRRHVVEPAMAGAAVTEPGERQAAAKRAELARPQISSALGQAVYWLTLLLFLPAILGALQLEGILGPVQGMVNRILAMLPSVFAAAIVLVVAYFVGRIVAGLSASLLSAIGLDRLSARVGLTRETTPPAWMPSRVVGMALMVVIVLVAAMEGLAIVNFERLSTMLGDVVSLIAQVAVGLLIFAVGVALSSLAARAIRTSNVQAAGFLANAARVAILVLTGAMGLQQMGLAQEIVNLAFGLLLGGIAIAVAIAFGVGGRNIAARELDNWIRATKERHAGERLVPPEEPIIAPH